MLRTGSSLPVALHGHIAAPQLLSVTGLVNLGLTGTFTLLYWCESQSHSGRRFRLVDLTGRVGHGQRAVQSALRAQPLRPVRRQGRSALRAMFDSRHRFYFTIILVAAESCEESTPRPNQPRARPNTARKCRSSSSISSGRATVWAISSRSSSRWRCRIRCTADLTAASVMPSSPPSCV